MEKRLNAESENEVDVKEPGPNESTVAEEVDLGESVSETCVGPQTKRKRPNQKDNAKKDDKKTKKVLLTSWKCRTV